MSILGDLSTDFGLLYSKFKLKYDDLKNIKTDRVNTVVFNSHQIKQLKFFGGHPMILQIWNFDHSYLNKEENSS